MSRFLKNNEEAKAYIRANYHNTSNVDLAKKLNYDSKTIYTFLKKENLVRTPEAIYEFRKKGQFKKGQVSPTKGLKWDQFMPKEKQEIIKKNFFKKGQVSPTKGLTWDEYMSKEKQEKLRKYNLFQKGETPLNIKPIGYERIVKGDVWVKYKNTSSKNYKLKKNIVWESVNGKIPSGFVIRHKDNNKQNNVIENLYIISKKEVMEQNSFNLLPNEIRTNCNLIAKIKRELTHE